MKCPHCQGAIRLVAEGGSQTAHEGAIQAARDSFEKKYVDIPSPAAFRELCYVLLKHPKLSEHKDFKGPLEDFPKSVDKYGRLTEGQSKFFSVIHKALTGTWPPKPEEMTLQTKRTPMEDLEGVPL